MANAEPIERFSVCKEDEGQLLADFVRITLSGRYGTGVAWNRQYRCWTVTGDLKQTLPDGTELKFWLLDAEANNKAFHNYGARAQAKLLAVFDQAVNGRGKRQKHAMELLKPVYWSTSSLAKELGLDEISTHGVFKLFAATLESVTLCKSFVPLWHEIMALHRKCNDPEFRTSLGEPDKIATMTAALASELEKLSWESWTEEEAASIVARMEGLFESAKRSYAKKARKARAQAAEESFSRLASLEASLNYSSLEQE